ISIFLGRGETVLLGAVLAVLIFIRHHANIRRLLTGTEPKIGRKTG
ncbi:glycerol-3-phosphate acyltransferase, partial [Rhodovulum sulfidophilum]|nr:glycerol-3-phosphate acyltransferase [Rhodovulum sulfidophilum]